MTGQVSKGPSNRRPATTPVAGGRFWAFLSAGVVAVMFVMAYAAPPLCDLYCPGAKKDGAGQSALPDVVLDRKMTIRFDANVNRLKWKFQPRETEITMKVGEVRSAFYRARNISEVATTGISTFNVTPLEAGPFFNLVECFCFTGHVLGAGETVDMPVRFFVDPAIADYPEFDDIRTITVSYTFFKAKKQLSRAQGGARNTATMMPTRSAANLN